MTQYRIVEHFNYYIIQYKKNFFWNNFGNYSEFGKCIIRFSSLAKAKKAANELIRIANATVELRTQKKNFKKQYYYPPFVEE